MLSFSLLASPLAKGFATIYLHDSAGDHPDEDGQQLPDLDAARRLAMETLGQLIIDDAARDRPGLKLVTIRDGSVPILRVSATVLVAKP